MYAIALHNHFSQYVEKDPFRNHRSSLSADKMRNYKQKRKGVGIVRFYPNNVISKITSLHPLYVIKNALFAAV